VSFFSKVQPSQNADHGLMAQWVGRIVLGDEWVLYAGEGGSTPMHKHLAHKIVVGLDAPIAVIKSDDAEAKPRKRLHIIQPGELHSLDAAGARTGLLFVDAGTFRHAVPPTIQEFKLLLTLLRQLDADGRAGELRLLDRPISVRAGRGVDSRVASTVAQLRTPMDSSLTAIAAGLGLSSGRLSTLFSSQIGAPPARYRRWRRLRLALELLGRGERIVDAALAAGFSDEAHFNRTAVEMIGITPGTFRSSSVVDWARLKSEGSTCL
jgi:AraC-like DNA-binding protein